VLPPFARNASYVCHEICHTIAKQLDIDDYHGPIFTRILLEVVREFMGEAQADELCQKFIARDVQISNAGWRVIAPFGSSDG